MRTVAATVAFILSLAISTAASAGVETKTSPDPRTVSIFQLNLTAVQLGCKAREDLTAVLDAPDAKTVQAVGSNNRSNGNCTWIKGQAVILALLQSKTDPHNGIAGCVARVALRKKDEKGYTVGPTLEYFVVIPKTVLPLGVTCPE